MLNFHYNCFLISTFQLTIALFLFIVGLMKLAETDYFLIPYYLETLLLIQISFYPSMEK